MKKRSLLIFFIITCGSVIAAFVAYFSFKEAGRSREIEQEIKTLEQEANKIRSNNQALQENVSYFETPEFQEKIAKEKLNLQKPEEKVVIVKPSTSLEDSSQSAPAAPASGTEKTLPNYLKWFNIFFK